MINLNYRVLCRKGARELTAGELEQINGGQAHTNVCSAFSVKTTTGDGDACTDHD